MISPSLSRFALIASLAIASLFVHASCARSGDSAPEVDSLTLFDPDAGDASPQNACVETRCPPPFATCPGEPGVCTTNLTNDIDHCGACGAKCPAPSNNASFVCSGSECKMVCDPLSADCNGSVADGCETATESDPANCGGCGVSCKEGVICWRGACGCPNGYTACGDDCKKLDSDDLNCSACGNICKPPANPADPAWRCGPNVTPPNTKWTCMSSACGLSCKGGFGDCNNQFCADGCELDLKTDPENCGACGRKCGAGQTCEAGTCLCPSNMINCDGVCVDWQTDARNCGLCGRRCPGPSANTTRKPGSGSPLCENGECSYVCFPGFADCDENVINGCETNINTSQGHCGGCGIQCNVPAGQPCVLGKCLTRECDAGVVF
jgi:hypothetical protein